MMCPTICPTIRHQAIRRGLGAFALVALLAPGLTFAQSGEIADSSGTVETAPSSLIGALMGAACGAGISVSRAAPAPIVVTVTFFTCALMLVDGWLSQDPH